MLNCHCVLVDAHSNGGQGLFSGITYIGHEWANIRRQLCLVPHLETFFYGPKVVAQSQERFDTQV